MLLDASLEGCAPYLLSSSVEPLDGAFAMVVVLLGRREAPAPA
jgi:hypothetical protein